MLRKGDVSDSEGDGEGDGQPELNMLWAPLRLSELN